MLERLPRAEVPKQLTRILCQNTNESKKALVHIQNMMNEDNFFQILIEKGMRGNKYNDIQKMFHSLGLRNFRNLLTAMYLEFYEVGHYTFKPDLSFIQDLLTFEDRFEEFGVSGGNRVFLLALYLKLADAHLQSKGLMGERELIDPPTVLEDLIALGASHQKDIDFLILLVWQLLEIWGEDELRKKLQVVKGDFRALLNQMTSEQRKLVASSILAYGCSVGLEHIFLFQKKV